MNVYQQQAKIFQALAHPVRVRILELLACEDEACVCHLVAAVGKRQPYISQQLTTLRKAGLVADRKDGLLVHYRLSDERVGELLQLGQDILRAQGMEVQPAPVLTIPLQGCTCPRCQAGQESRERVGFATNQDGD
ncbi:MAG: metalloregulator ArsR/SmtB family transcription factor [Anaerolineae bacterium]|jgi:ArsR family transcriptional regulator|nr:metalloregulator ArsR/SmtB family transcription factor [Anaerolineae bacterium]MDH7475238.1 metalloregulator ArsR/SmtB family transcription factor [Anaerolineae bacterium]